MMVKIFLKFLHALAIYLIDRRSFGQKYKFSNKNDMVRAWRNFKKKKILDHFSPSFLGQKC